ncbi:hypothetical protein [Clostridium coskatii]|uniref:Uncharacterized protein n=1 Tax=Clostridium coskatii TaxID=1705578 RepID=A0A162KVJ9_9CLOT|nr:hypothetical protein [Clostridium coskatii]OAA87562.1 hypothetical protein WX73_02744 [Clostridium coskatii]OBR96462.1 hypothetical protein CLCOS_09000 [Clostridium coskatii]
MDKGLETIVEKGLKFLNNGDYEKALIDLDKSIKLDSSDWRAVSFRNKYISLFKGNGCC